MARMPEPTQRQLRQHALDRALQPDLVAAIERGLVNKEQRTTGRPEEVCMAIIATADRFAEWLGAAEEGEVAPDGVTNWGEATTHQLILTLEARLVRAGESKDAEQVRSLLDTLPAGVLYRAN